MIMKTLILTYIASVAALSLSSCTTVEQKREPVTRSTTTTTEQSSVHRPSSETSTTETRSSGSY